MYKYKIKVVHSKVMILTTLLMLECNWISH